MTAKKMFESLGYTLIRSDNCIISYEKNKINALIRFVFVMEDKKFYSEYNDVAHDITMDEFKAIQQQLKELGWLEEEKQEIKQESNFEHYKDGIIEFCIDELAISKGKVVECNAIPCSECDFEDKNGHCIGNREIIKWLKQPYKKPVYKLTKFEKELLQCYPDTNSFKLFNSLNGMKKKGYFKGIDDNEIIGDILEKSDVLG